MQAEEQNKYPIINEVITNTKFVAVLCFLIGSVFVFSAISKLIDIEYFAKIIAGYPFIPTELRSTLAYTISTFELLCGIALLVNFRIRIVTYLLIVLTIVFTIVSFYRYLLGDISSCGCFGTIIDRKNDLSLIIENSIIILGILWIQRSND